MIVDLLKAAILGTVQGLTEFLPVSSTGHLIIAEDLLNVDSERYGLAFDASLHLDTLLALLLYFRVTWWRLLRAGAATLRTRSIVDPAGRLAWLIVIGTIPAGVLGLLLEDQIEDAFREPALVAVMLIAFSGVFVIAERIGRRLRTTADLNVADAVIVGLAQAAALVPGISRSGATISVGLMRDLRREEAATFAFLLSAPIVGAAGLRGALSAANDFADGTLDGEDLAFFVTGFVFAACVGYAAIAFLLRFLRTNTLMPFVVYRVGLGVAVLIVLGVQAVS
jgi:undecaprenyl-diphosphatase